MYNCIHAWVSVCGVLEVLEMVAARHPGACIWCGVWVEALAGVVIVAVDVRHHVVVLGEWWSAWCCCASVATSLRVVCGSVFDPCFLEVCGPGC